MRRLILVTMMAVAVACADGSAEGEVAERAEPVVTTSTTVATTTAEVVSTTASTTSTTTAAPTSTTGPAPSSTIAPVPTTVPPATTEPTPTSEPTPATSAPPTTTEPAPSPMADAGDLVGTLSIAEAEWVAGQSLTVTLTVTNVADRHVALEDRAELRFLAARIGDDALTSAFLWLGDTEVGPGESHTMTRSWDPEIAPVPGEALTMRAVIAESADSFNRVQNTVGVVTGVPAVVIPVAASS